MYLLDKEDIIMLSEERKKNLIFLWNVRLVLEMTII